MSIKSTALPPLRRRKRSLEKRKAMKGYFFVLPLILGIALVYLPLLIARSALILRR